MHKCIVLDGESFSCWFETDGESNNSYPCLSKTKLKQDNFLEVSTI